MKNACIPTVAIVLAATSAQAAKVDPDRWLKAFPVRLGSHVIAAAKPKGGMASLSLDGKVVDKGAARYDLNFEGGVDGVPMAAIYADRGGASCYDGTELLFAAPAGKPVVQGSVDGRACEARPKVGLGGSSLVVVNPPVAEKPADATPAVASDPGEVWTFDAAHGAERAMAIGPEGPDQE